jgi:23S rRNA (uracil1939-C5)-methyltransferase
LPVDITIDDLGSRGDGIGRIGDRRLYIPLTVPGDRVRVEVGGARGDGFAARLLDLVEPGPTRVQPPCPYFGTCGGCALQHLADDAYRQWKQNQVAIELRHRGIENAPLDPLVAIPAATASDHSTGRRRAILSAVRRAGEVILGFNARGSRQVVDIDRCLLLTAAINRRLEPLSGLFAELLRDGERGQAMVTDLDGSIDILLVLPRALDLTGRERAAVFAERADVARIAWRSKDGSAADPIVHRRPCLAVFGTVAVEFPPGAFLQPSAAGEAALRDRVLEGVGNAARVADLFAGLGAFTFALAGRAGLHRGWRVHAVDADPALVQALAQAVDRAGLAGRVTSEARDLDRRPLTVSELEPYDAVVFDPPRPGARSQAQAIAAARGLARIVAVSCNPATFARDARILIDGGFRLERVIPIDQFVFAPHVEVVGLFRRPSVG